MRWPSVSLVKISTLGPQYGANARATERSGLRPRYVRITDIDSNGRLRPDDAVEADIRDDADFLLENGDLLFARSGNTVGKSYRYSKEDGECIFAGYMIRFRVDPLVADSRFVFYFTQSPVYQNWVLSKKRVAGQPNINGTEYASLEIPLPPLPEQRRIVEILDQADALRKLRREADALSERILPALFYKMFGDPVRNERGWDMTEIQLIAEVKGGKRLPKGSDYSQVPTPFRYIRGTDIEANRIVKENLKYLYPETQSQIGRYTVDMDDVVITIAGKTGVVAPVVDEDLIGVNLTENAARIVPRKKGVYDPVYLSAYLNLPAAQQEITGHVGRVTIEKLALFRIEKLRVVLPPVELQKFFRDQVNMYNCLLAMQNESGKKLVETFESLLHRAFTGELTKEWREQ